MLPMLVGHAPVEHRDRLDAMFRDLLVDGNTHLSSQAHQIAAHLPGRTREARFAAIAAWADAVASHDAADWQVEVSVWRDRVIAGALDALEQSKRLAGADAPDEWRQVIERAMAVNRATIGQPAPESLVAEARACCTQLATTASAWQAWWSDAAAGWAATWRERLRVPR